MSFFSKIWGANEGGMPGKNPKDAIKPTEVKTGEPKSQDIAASDTA